SPFALAYRQARGAHRLSQPGQGVRLKWTSAAMPTTMNPPGMESAAATHSRIARQTKHAISEIKAPVMSQGVAACLDLGAECALRPSIGERSLAVRSAGFMRGGAGEGNGRSRSWPQEQT